MITHLVSRNTGKQSSTDQVISQCGTFMLLRCFVLLRNLLWRKNTNRNSSHSERTGSIPTEWGQRWRKRCSPPSQHHHQSPLCGRLTSDSILCTLLCSTQSTSRNHKHFDVRKQQVEIVYELQMYSLIVQCDQLSLIWVIVCYLVKECAS